MLINVKYKGLKARNAKVVYMIDSDKSSHIQQFNHQTYRTSWYVLALQQWRVYIIHIPLYLSMQFVPDIKYKF